MSNRLGKILKTLPCVAPMGILLEGMLDIVIEASSCSQEQPLVPAGNPDE